MLLDEETFWQWQNLCSHPSKVKCSVFNLFSKLCGTPCVLALPKYCHIIFVKVQCCAVIITIPSQLANLVFTNHHIWMVLVTCWSQYLKKCIVTDKLAHAIPL